MSLRRFAFAAALFALVPACSAIVNPDTSRLGDGRDSGNGTLDGGGVDVGPGVDTGMPGHDAGGICAAGCDDGIPCTTDSCDATGTCRHTPDNTLCPVGQRCTLTMGCQPGTGCASAADCNDHVDCTTDSCNAGTCEHAPSDAACNDAIACTTDTCTLDGCHHEANDAACNGGCFTGASCQVGVGCQGGFATMCVPDGNPCTVDPTMCDAATGTCLHPPRDDDGDGHPIAVANGAMGVVTCPGGDDCNDNDPNVYPGATELCNGIDDNCNGAIDETGCMPAGPDDCSTEMQIPLASIGGGSRGGSVTGSNFADNDDYTSMCGGSGGRDAVYYVDIPAGGGGAVDVTFTTDTGTTTFDTVLSVAVGNTCGSFGASMRQCNDDISSTNHSSLVTICVPGGTAAGTRVHVLVDGYDGTATGNYGLDVTVSSHPGGVCP